MHVQKKKLGKNTPMLASPWRQEDRSSFFLLELLGVCSKYSTILKRNPRKCFQKQYSRIEILQAKLLSKTVTVYGVM